MEKKGRKTFSRGIWAPEAHISAARAALEAERATPAYAKRRASDAARREREQAEYEVDFANAVLRFLALRARLAAAHAKRLAVAVAAHATPVGSGTVARTERIPIERRAEAAVIAWMRHQTTGYDDMSHRPGQGRPPRGAPRPGRDSRALLDLHRRDAPHPAAEPSAVHRHREPSQAGVMASAGKVRVPGNDQPGQDGRRGPLP